MLKQSLLCVLLVCYVECSDKDFLFGHFPDGFKWGISSRDRVTEDCKFFSDFGNYASVYVSMSVKYVSGSSFTSIDKEVQFKLAREVS